MLFLFCSAVRRSRSLRLAVASAQCRELGECSGRRVNGVQRTHRHTPRTSFADSACHANDSVSQVNHYAMKNVFPFDERTAAATASADDRRCTAAATLRGLQRGPRRVEAIWIDANKDHSENETQTQLRIFWISFLFSSLNSSPLNGTLGNCLFKIKL